MNLSSYGYRKSDQDGYDSSDPSSIVTPEQHKEEEFFAALIETFDAKVIETPPEEGDEINQNFELLKEKLKK